MIRLRSWTVALALALLAPSVHAQPMPPVVETTAAPVEPAPRPPAASHETTFKLEDLGFTASERKNATRPAMSFGLPSRTDRVLTEARLQLELSRKAVDPSIEGLEVLVNDERVALLDAAALAKPNRSHDIAIAPALIGEHNAITFRFLTPGGAPFAGEVPAGSWELVDRGVLQVRSSSLKLANDLALLPLPFYDERFDREARLPIAFLGQNPGPDEVRVAALMASWFGLRAGARVQFPITMGGLPDDNAVVLAVGSTGAAALGMEAPQGPTLRMIDHPRATTDGRKLLVLAGRDLAEVETAALAFALGQAPLRGARALIEQRPDVPVVGRYDAPRWLPSARKINFGEIPGGKELAHEGTGGGSLRLPFRLAPDLFFWPSSRNALELNYAVTLPPGMEPPRVAVELNGHYLGTLPLERHRSGAWGRTKLAISPDHLGGYNELAFHVEYRGGRAGAAGKAVRFTVDAASALRLDPPTHFAAMPNLSLFVHDGFPFTRRPDLSETVAVIADAATPAELATLFSTVAHFAAVTGRIGTGLAVAQASRVPDELGRTRDVLAIGGVHNHGLIRRLQDRLPLYFDGTQPRVQMPQRTAFEAALELVAGRTGHGEIARADEIAVHSPTLTAAMALRSPYAETRTAVIVTAGKPEMLPPLVALQGYAEARERTGDLLMAVGEDRWMFRIGPSYATGDLDGWRRLLWFLAQHWMALFPFLALGMTGLSLVLRATLRDRVRARMIEIGETVP